MKVDYCLSVTQILYKIEIDPSLFYFFEGESRRPQKNPEDEKLTRVAQAFSKLHEAQTVEEKTFVHLFLALTESKPEGFETKENQIETLTKLHEAAIDRFNRAKSALINICCAKVSSF